MYTHFLQSKIFSILSDSAEQQGIEAYVIGGFVRDCFLERQSKDIDIVVAGNGIEFARQVAKAIGGRCHVSVFENFGTAMLRFDDWEVEFVGARKESYRRDSRKPIVENGTLEDDQIRRDFTINALAISLNKADYGTLVDPFGGLIDLDNKILRTPADPDITFSDDPLRMMRAVRFASQLDFEIEKETFEAIQRNASRIEIVSKERIIDEFNKLMLSPRPSIGLDQMEKTGLMAIVFPEFQRLKGVENIQGKMHKDVFYHTLQVVDNLSKNTNDLWLRWAALLHDIAKPGTKRFQEGTGWTFHGHEVVGERLTSRIFNRMKLPLDGRMHYVQKMVGLHLRPIALVKEEVTDSAVRRLLFDAGDDIDDLMLLCQADITSKNEKLKQRYLDNFQLVRQKLREIEEKDAIRNFQPPVDGNEIIETFGLPPCKEIGIIKNAIKDAILDGLIANNHDEAYNFMLDKAKVLGLEIVKMKK